MKNKKRKYKRRYILLLIIFLLLFSLKWFTSRPRTSSFSSSILEAKTDMISLEQDKEVLAMLKKNKPRIYVHKESYKPMDFYKDYVSNAKLKKSGFFDTKISDQVDKEKLGKYSSDPNYYLDYNVAYKKELRKELDELVPMYGRAYRSKLVYDNKEIELIFLKYTLVYPYSGLPSEISGLKYISSNILGNPKAWHELDIHGAVHIILFADTLEAAGVLLAQHNHHRTYIYGEDIMFPSDGHIKISVAKMSNEPYIMSNDNGARIERTVGNPTDLEFLLGMSDDVPITAGFDYVPSLEESIEVESYIEQLSLDDPLYQSLMSLGKIKKILGITRSFFLDGPPGADFYAMPDFIDLADLSAFSNIDITDEYKDIYSRSEYGFFNNEVEELMKYQRKNLYEKLIKLQSK